MIQLDENLRELRKTVVYLTTNCNARAYPTEFQTYDVAWDELRQSINHLKFKLGPERYPKLLKMLEQAKAHYDAEIELEDDEQGKLGSWLMQDIELIIEGKQPAVYPKELHRW